MFYFGQTIVKAVTFIVGSQDSETNGKAYYSKLNRYINNIVYMKDRMSVDGRSSCMQYYKKKTFLCRI